MIAAMTLAQVRQYRYGGAGEIDRRSAAWVGESSMIVSQLRAFLACDCVVFAETAPPATRLGDLVERSATGPARGMAGGGWCRRCDSAKRYRLLKALTSRPWVNA